MSIKLVQLRDTRTGVVSETSLDGAALELFLRENPDIVRAGLNTTADYPHYILLNQNNIEFQDPKTSDIIYNPFLNRLGIGSLNPAATLDVSGDIKFNGNFSNSGVSSFFGPANFYNDVVFDRLEVGIATVRDKLDVGFGGTVLTAIGSTSDLLGVATSFYGNIGIGSTLPQEKLDVAGSIKIDANIYDSADDPGLIGSFLSNDINGIRWVGVNPLESKGILVYNDLSLVGSGQSFFGINLITGDGLGITTDSVEAFVNPINPNIADILIYDYWSPLSSGNIYRNSNVGINNQNPLFSLDITGTANITEILNVGGNLDVGGTLIVDGLTELNSTLDVDGATTLNDTLDVDGATTLNNTLDVDGATTLNSTLQVGIAGTIITTTGIGSVGFGTNAPERDIQFKEKDVFFDGSSIYDTNENVGFRSEQYQVPRNVLTTVGVDTSGSIIDGRFFDAANLIRLNLNFIANEAIGFLTSTDYKNPAFTIVNSVGIVTDPVNCKDDIKDILKAITYDITRGGNSRSVGAGLSYYNGNTLLHITGSDINGYSVKDATIAGIRKSVEIARYVINNSYYPTSYQMQAINGTYADAGRLILRNKDFIATEAVDRTKSFYPSLVIPGGNQSCVDDIKIILDAIIYNIQFGGNSRVYDAAAFYTVNPVLSGEEVEAIYAYEQTKSIAIQVIRNETVTKISGILNTYTQFKDLTVLVDPIVPTCQNQASAITSFVGIVTNAIQSSTLPNRTDPTIKIPVSQIRDLTLIDDPNRGSNTDPDGCSNVVSAITVCAGIVTTIIDNGPSASPRTTYPDGKVVWAPAGADSKNIIYVSKYGNDDNNGRTEGAAKLTVASAAVEANPGDTIMIRSGIYYENNPIGFRTDVTISGQDLRLVTIIPNNPNKDVFHVRRGCLVENLNFSGIDITVDHTNCGAVAFPPTNPSDYAISGYISPGPATEGPSGRWRSPYIRNCTNFMTKSIGMKINGNHATAATIGNDLKCMVCDSFTQYNEAGIGVSITNNGYAQLVSIFTINCDIAIYADTGGSCDLTNSNSSFGNFGLVAVGLGSTEFTGIVSTYPPNRSQPGVDAGSDKVTFANMKDGAGNVRRPYDGQSLFFKINLNNYPDSQGTGILQTPMVRVKEVKITNNGSGYSPLTPPTVFVYDNNDQSQQPKGPQGIIAELSPTIDEVTGAITSIDVVNSGRNYLPTQDLKVFIDGGSATADVIIEPIYYSVDSATEETPVTGITTVTFTEFLPYELFGGEEVSLKRISRILTSSHSFEYIGTGTDINTSTPFKGGVSIKENEIVALDGAQIPFTSTDQKGNFDIGEGFQINQPSAVIRGRDFSKAIQAEVTPLILALR